MLLGNVSLGTFVWPFPLGNVRLNSLRELLFWVARFETIAREFCSQERSLSASGLGVVLLSFVWELSLGI